MSNIFSLPKNRVEPDSVVPTVKATVSPCLILLLLILLRILHRDKTTSLHFSILLSRYKNCLGLSRDHRLNIHSQNQMHLRFHWFSETVKRNCIQQEIVEAVLPLDFIIADQYRAPSQSHSADMKSNPDPIVGDTITFYIEAVWQWLSISSFP